MATAFHFQGTTRRESGPSTLSSAGRDRLPPSRRVSASPDRDNKDRRTGAWIKLGVGVAVAVALTIGGIELLSSGGPVVSPNLQPCYDQASQILTDYANSHPGQSSAGGYDAYYSFLEQCKTDVINNSN